MSTDYLMHHDDEAAMLADLADHMVETDDGPRLGGHVIPGVTVYLALPVYGEPDPETGDVLVTTPAVVLPGYWTWISTPNGRDEGIMAREACRIVVDPVAAAAGQPYVVFVRDPDLAAQVVLIEPMPGLRTFPYGDLRMIE